MKVVRKSRAESDTVNSRSGLAELQPRDRRGDHLPFCVEAYTSRPITPGPNLAALVWRDAARRSKVLCADRLRPDACKVRRRSCNLPKCHRTATGRRNWQSVEARGSRRFLRACIRWVVVAACPDCDYLTATGSRMSRVLWQKAGKMRFCGDILLGHLPRQPWQEP